MPIGINKRLFIDKPYYIKNLINKNKQYFEHLISFSDNLSLNKLVQDNGNIRLRFYQDLTRKLDIMFVIGINDNNIEMIGAGYDIRKGYKKSLLSVEATEMARDYVCDIL